MNIRLEHLRKEFSGTVALDDLSITFQSGKLTTLLGPSGCGKSTLLNLISGILPVSGGGIFFGDREVTKLQPDKRNVGLVFQNYALYPHMSVCDNIAFPLEIKKVPKAKRRERAYELAQLLQISDYFERKPAQLSGGQQQRVAIARALAKEPDILLLDEPLSNLDARLRLEMREEIRRLQLKTGITTIFVTHDQEEALSISDYILLMRKGTIQQYGMPQELYDHPANSFVADFLGNPPINMFEATVDGPDRLVTADGVLFHYPTGSLDAGRPVRFGVRSEAFVVTDQADKGTPAQVSNVFLNGKETLYLLQMGQQSVRATFNGSVRFAAGDTILIQVGGEHSHLFDAESGMVL